MLRPETGQVVHTHIHVKGRCMLRRMIATMIVVMGLAVVMVAPAAALTLIGPPTEYAIRDVEFISGGGSVSFYRVETYERRLTLDQADELCQDLGFDSAVGIDRERYDGGRFDVVTCRSNDSGVMPPPP